MPATRQLTDDFSDLLGPIFRADQQGVRSLDDDQVVNP